MAYHVGKQNPYMHLTGEGLANGFLKINELGNSEHSVWIADYEQKIRKLSKSEVFVRWHIEKYEARLPIWAALEVLDFGALSKLLRSVGQGLAHTIGDDFNLDPPALKSWVACMNELRNVVAHNGRIWNRSFVVSPVTRIKNLPSDLGHLSSLGRPEKYKIYPRIEFLLWLQNQEILGQNFSNRLLDLLASFPESGHLSIAQMGFPLE